jgi:hypothetical protein
MLLEKIASSKEAKDVWPPKMDNIATSVQQMFAENPQQYPVYKYYRGWQGNESIDSLPADGAPAPAKAADPIVRLDAVNGLALMLAKHLARPTQRDDVLNAFEYCPPLGPSISGRVERRSDALGDCKQIISTCLKFSGGIELLERVTLGNLGQIRDHDAIVLSFKSLSSLRDEAVTNV